MPNTFTFTCLLILSAFDLICQFFFDLYFCSFKKVKFQTQKDDYEIKNCSLTSFHLLCSCSTLGTFSQNSVIKANSNYVFVCTLFVLIWVLNLFISSHAGSRRTPTTSWYAWTDIYSLLRHRWPTTHSQHSRLPNSLHHRNLIGSL